jgi:serine protease
LSIGKKTLKQLYEKHDKSNLRLSSTKQGPDLSLIYEITFSSTKSIGEVILQLQADPHIQYAEPKYISKSLYTPNDPNIGTQYYLNLLKSFQAWDVSKGDSNVVIGVTDEGFDLTHPDLINSIKYNYKDPIDGVDNDNDGYIDNYYGWNVASNNNNVTVDGSLDHGVAVAGLAAATTDNATGMAGTGFRCKFLPIKIEAANALKNEFNGIVYAADHGCQIINCSWGHVGGYSQYEQDIINYATSKNCLVLASAGNNNDEGIFFPASYQYVISVAATNNKDQKGTWVGSSGPHGSNYGHYVDVCAPGVDVYTTVKGGGYVGYANGTSFACPIASGCAAIIKSKYPAYNGLQVGERLRATCDFIDTVNGNASFAGKLGRGRINLFRALTVNTPSIRMDPISISDGKGNNFLAGDTFQITGKFTNFLDPASNLSINISSNSGFITIVNANVNIGAMGTLTVADISKNPFLVRVNPNTPSFTIVTFKITYTDGTYIDYQYFDIVVNPDYMNLAINNINTTITSNGSFGFSKINQVGGLGFNFKNNAMLYAGGLILNSGNKTIDAIYGTLPNSMDTDFTVTAPVRQLKQSTFSDEDILSKFSDSLAAAQKIGVLITHKAYAWKSAADSNYVILEYTLKNTNKVKIDSLYTGFYADWDIDTSYQNRADFNPGLKMSYAYSAQANSHYGGIKLLTPGQLFSYAIDNPGGAGLIGIYNGFSKANKKYVLQHNKYTAGSNGKGNDVSIMLSTGPVSLLAGDSVKVAFAITAGLSTNMINAAATAADIKYNKPRIITKGKLNFCQGDSVLLTSSLAPAYQWNTGEVTRSITVKKTGKYSVSVPGSIGTMLSSDTLNIFNSSTAIISSSRGSSFCTGDSTRLSSTPALAYKWSNGSAQPSFYVSTPGTYALSTIDSNGCKSQSTSITLNLKTAPQAQITVNGPTTFCQGGNTSLLASAGSSYLWSNGEANQGINVSSSGAYTVVIKASNGCSTKSLPVTITVKPAPNVTISNSGPLSFCRLDSVILTASGGTGYQWSTGATKPRLVVSASGDYSVTVKDANTCTAFAGPLHVQVDSGPQKPLILQTKNVLTSSIAAFTYQWYLNQKIIIGATNQDLSINANGIYTVRIADVQGCSILSDAFASNGTLGITDYSDPAFFLYQNQPNPCSKLTSIRFEIPNSTKVELSLYSVFGEKLAAICNADYSAGTYNQDVDISNLADGIYYYTLHAGGITISKRLVVLNK